MWSTLYSGFQDLCNKKATKIGACALLAIQNYCERTRMCGFRHNFVAKILKTAVSESIIKTSCDHYIVAAGDTEITSSEFIVG